MKVALLPNCLWGTNFTDICIQYIFWNLFAGMVLKACLWDKIAITIMHSIITVLHSVCIYWYTTWVIIIIICSFIAVSRHQVPIGQMGNYQKHLKRINPLRELDTGDVRTQLFGNPFKLEKPSDKVMCMCSTYLHRKLSSLFSTWTCMYLVAPHIVIDTQWWSTNINSLRGGKKWTKYMLILPFTTKLSKKHCFGANLTHKY